MFQTEPRGSIAYCGHEGSSRRSQQTEVGKLRSPVFRNFERPGLFTADINIVATGIEGGLNDFRPVVNKWPSGVANYLGAAEQFTEFVDAASGFRDLVISGLDARHVVHDIADFGSIASRGDKGKVVLAQKFRDQPAGKTVGSVDNDWARAHGVGILIQKCERQ